MQRGGTTGGATGGTLGSTTGGGTGGGTSTTFSGMYTATTALYEGGTAALDPNQLVINLLSQQLDCATWQDANASITGYDLQIALNGDMASSYSLLDPTSSQAGRETPGTGIAVDAYFVPGSGESGVTSMSGTATISAVSAGKSVAGSLQITWNDGETLTVAPFTANYCTDTNNWGGTFVPQTAFFTTNANTTSILLLNTTITCADWQNASVPFGTATWDILVEGTAAGTYALTAPAAAQTGHALAYQTYSNATVSSTGGSVTLSAVSSTGITVAVPSVSWSVNQNSTMAAVTAVPCAF